MNFVSSFEVDYGWDIYDFLKFVGGLWALKCAWQTFFVLIDRY